MGIKIFSDEEKAAIAGDASARFKKTPLGVYLAEPIDITLVLAPFDRAAYHEYSDAEDRDPQSAYSSALMGRLLFPDLVALNTANTRWPALAEEATKGLLREAGSYVGVTCDLLSLDALPAGLSADDAKGLREAAKGANLWTVTLKDKSGALVLATPDAPTWIAARAMYDDAKRKGRGCLDAIDPHVQSAVVWSSTPIASILAARPALLWALWTSYKRAGGEGAALRTFRF